MLQLLPISRNALTKCYKRPGSYCKTVVSAFPPFLCFYCLQNQNINWWKIYNWPSVLSNVALLSFRVSSGFDISTETAVTSLFLFPSTLSTMGWKCIKLTRSCHRKNTSFARAWEWVSERANKLVQQSAWVKRMTEWVSKRMEEPGTYVSIRGCSGS